jgi:hypothetical protein
MEVSLVFSLFRNSDMLASTFHWSEDPSRAWLVPSTAEDPELKIKRKNPGSPLRTGEGSQLGCLATYTGVVRVASNPGTVQR